jgi:hypothetical protein
VVEPGWQQMEAAYLILVATLGITFSLQARFSDNASVDVPVRLVLAALALAVLFYPTERVAMAVTLPVLLMIGYWLVRRRTVLDSAAPSATEPLTTPVAVRVADTERGRMS